MPLQLLSLDSEEQSVLPIDDSVVFSRISVSPSLPPPIHNSVLPSTCDGHSIFPAAFASADPSNDGSGHNLPVGVQSPGFSGGFCPITQDEDVDPPILNDVAHQLARIVADLTDDEHF